MLGLNNPFPELRRAMAGEEEEVIDGEDKVALGFLHTDADVGGNEQAVEG